MVHFLKSFALLCIKSWTLWRDVYRPNFLSSFVITLRIYVVSAFNPFSSFYILFIRKMQRLASSQFQSITARNKMETHFWVRCCEIRCFRTDIVRCKLIMQIMDTSETSINISQTTKRHISEDAKLQPPVRPCSQMCQVAQCLGSRLLYKVS